MKNPYDRCVKSKLERDIKRITDPIFNRVPQEIKQNTMSGVPPIIFFWRPNNYRLQFNFKIETFKRNTTLASGVTPLNFGTKFIYKDFYNSTIILDIPKHKKPAKITAIYKPIKRFYYELKCYNLAEIDTKINERVKSIENKLIYALNQFISKYGGSYVAGSKKWVRFEDDVHNEDFIDKIPRDLVITDTYFKKVYQQGIEFKNPAYVKTYISNRVVEEITPEIAEAINTLGTEFNQFTARVTPAIENLAMNMGTHISIMKDIKKGINEFRSVVKDLNNQLKQTKLNRWL